MGVRLLLGVFALAAGVVGCAPTTRTTVATTTGGDACQGVDASSFALVDPQRGRVEPLEEEVGKQRLRTVRGVRILLAAERGVTPAYARRVTACRLQKSPGAMPTGQDIVVNAREIADGLEITVTSEDPAVARAIVEAHKS